MQANGMEKWSELGKMEVACGATFRKDYSTEAALRYIMREVSIKVT